MLPYLREDFGNPSSGHVYGRRAHEAVEAARARVAVLIGAAAEEIVFTSGGTESNDLAIRGVAAARPERIHIVTSAIEHPATNEPCRALGRARWVVSRARVDAHGRVLLDDTRLLQEKTSLITLIHASNETGMLQPVAEFAVAAHAVGAIVHTDAAHSVGKVPVDVNALGVDLLSIAGHKLYAPKGVGALYVRRGTPIVPVLLGAEQEHALRPGTENVASIVGLGAACETAARTLEEEGKRVAALRDALWRQLRTGIPGILLNGHERERLPNTLNVRLPGARGQAVLDACPEVAASTGSACHAGSEAPSKVLAAMGLEEVAREGRGNVRFILADARELADWIDEPVDVVFFANTFHGVAGKNAICVAIRRVLVPGGRLVVVNWHALPREQTPILGRPRGPQTELRISPAATRAAVEPAGFREVRVTDVGPYHYAAIFEATTGEGEDPPS